MRKGVPSAGDVAGLFGAFRAMDGEGVEGEGVAGQGEDPGGENREDPTEENRGCDLHKNNVVPPTPEKNLQPSVRFY